MSREMAKDSQFERIVLIKGFNDNCSSDLRERVGRYTHIQSINGRFLDGLTVDSATEIFQSLKHPHVQLIVRFIYRIKRSDTRLLAALPHHSSTHIRRQRSSKTDGDAQALPTPLFILGDNSQLQRVLFDLLSSKDPVSDSHDLSIPAVESTLSPNLAGSPHPAASPISSDVNPLLSPHSKEDILTSLKEVQRGLAATGVRMRRGSCRELSESDKCIERAEVPIEKFEVESSSLPNLAKNDATTPLQSRPRYGRQFSTRPQIAKQQFILHMLKKDVDRQFAHIFLKLSGIYLVVVGLDDVLGDPLIQYENLFYWLRLIQTHVRPDELKRVIVVGMYHKSEVQRSDLILKCVQLLNTAIQDQMKQNFSLPTEEKGFVFMFDLDNAQTDLQYLCASIKSLMEFHIDQAWFFFREYFESVFLPFDIFRKVCTQLSQVGKSKVAEPSKNIRKVIGSPLPDKAFETVAAYATGCIDSKGDSLLRPSFIPDLLTTFTEPMSHHDYQIHMVLPAFLRHLPIVNSPLLSARMAQLGAPERKEQELIFEWLKRFEFAYSIGKIGGRGEGKETFFVPFLAAASQSDNTFFNWDPDLEAQFDDCPVVLYTQLHIPATEHFYHRLIASLLSDAVKSSQHQKPCYIKLGCEAAILPLQSEDRDSPNTLFQVLLKYHAVQNIIESRTREPKSLLLLKAIEAKLLDTFTSSRYCSVSDFKGAFSFHIPAEEFEQTLREGPIWKLGSVDVNAGDHDRPEDVLLKTKLLTHPGHTKNPELKVWASSHPQMKELPSDLYLYLQRKLSTNDRYWTLVASKLDLLRTDDIDYYRRNPAPGGNGGIVLQKWKDSRLTFKDLVSALKSQDVGLDEAATRVEKHFLAEEFEQTLKEGPIWKLGSVGVGSAVDTGDHDRPEDVLLKTKLLTQPGHTRNPELRARASSHPQMKELPTDLYLYLQRKLSSNDRYWALVGSKLNLLSTDDIDYYRTNPETGGNGGIVLQKWKDSKLTFKDLVSALESSDVGLNEAAARVEKHFLGVTESSSENFVTDRDLHKITKEPPSILLDPLGISSDVVSKVTKQATHSDKIFTVFKEWLNLNPDATVADLAKCLRQADLDKIADQPQKSISTPPDVAVNTDAVTNMKGFIRGASIIAETDILITNDAQKFVWKNSGLKFVIRKNSLPEGVSTYAVNIRASMSGQYDFPSGYRLVSAIYWVTSPGKFAKAITVEIQHCAQADNSKLSFIVAKCSQRDLPYRFHLISGGAFTPNSNYGVISLSEFSGYGTVQEESGYEYYCAQVYYEQKLGQGCWQCHFCLIKDLEICFTTVREQYQKMGREPQIHNLRISFREGSDYLKLNIPREGIISQGWMIIPLYNPIITKANAERQVAHREEVHVASCELMVKWQDSEKPPVTLIHAIDIMGVMQHDSESYFQIFVDPSKEFYGSVSKPSDISSGASVSAMVGVETQLAHKPTLKDLMTALYHKVAGKWSHLGILLEISQDTIATIVGKKHNDPQDCLIEMLTVWLQRVDPPPTWTAIIEAIKILGDEKLALNLTSKYCQ